MWTGGLNADPEVQKRSKEALLSEKTEKRDRKTQKLKIKGENSKTPKKPSKRHRIPGGDGVTRGLIRPVTCL